MRTLLSKPALGVVLEPERFVPLASVRVVIFPGSLPAIQSSVASRTHRLRLHVPTMAVGAAAPSWRGFDGAVRRAEQRLKEIDG